MRDEVVETLKGHRVDQVVLGLAPLLPRLDAAVVHLPLPPET